jgi:hypothetical protein
LTLLHGSQDAGTTALLTEGLLPLLHRRAADASVVAPRDDEPVLMPFPERRGRTRLRPSEIVVLVDSGGDDPLDRLRARVDAALRAADVAPGAEALPLAERLSELGAQFNARFLLVFDGFEELLTASSDLASSDALFDELVGIINSAAPAHILLAMNCNPQSQVRMDAFAARLSAIAVDVIRLPDTGSEPQGARRTPPLRAVSRPVAADQTLVIRRQIRPQELPDARAQPRPRATPAAAAHDPSQTIVQAPTGRAHRRRYSIAAGWAAGVALAGLAPLLLPPPATRNDAQILATASLRGAISGATPAPREAAAVRPLLELFVDGEAGSESGLPYDLARAVQADGGAALRIRPASDVLGSLSDTSTLAPHLPRVAIARYEALRASNKLPLAIVAPLYTEELSIAVRTDSPLEFIHQIEGRRVNIGPSTDARAVTATALYRRMFDAPVPATEDGSLDARTAMSRLTRGRTLDAVVLVGTTGSAIPAELRRKIKWLRLDPLQPASRRALQAFLPATLHEGAAPPIATLASVAFLVTSKAAREDDAEALSRFVGSLCRALPGLRRSGDPKWREVKAGLELPTGLPIARATEAAWASCMLTAEGMPILRPDAPVTPLQTHFSKGLQ